jgi:hypothetical protein
MRPDSDQDQPLGVLAHPPLGGQTRGPRPDDRDIDLAFRHDCPPD